LKFIRDSGVVLVRNNIININVNNIKNIIS
jgi:hypothetical protein